MKNQNTHFPHHLSQSPSWLVIPGAFQIASTWGHFEFKFSLQIATGINFEKEIYQSYWFKIEELDYLKGFFLSNLLTICLCSSDSDSLTLFMSFIFNWGWLENKVKVSNNLWNSSIPFKNSIRSKVFLKNQNVISKTSSTPSNFIQTNHINLSKAKLEK